MLEAFIIRITGGTIMKKILSPVLNRGLVLTALLAVLTGGINAEKVSRKEGAVFAAVAGGETFLEFKQNLAAIKRLSATDPRDLHFSLAQRGAEVALGVVRHLWRTLNAFLHADSVNVGIQKSDIPRGIWGLPSILFFISTITPQIIKLIHQFTTRHAFNLSNEERVLFASYNAHHLSTQEKEELALLEEELTRTAKIITGAETVFNAAIGAGVFGAHAITGNGMVVQTNANGWAVMSYGGIDPKFTKHPLKRVHTYALPVLMAAATHAYNSIKLRNRMYTYINDILKKARALHEKGELRLVEQAKDDNRNDQTPSQPALTAH